MLTTLILLLILFVPFIFCCLFLIKKPTSLWTGAWLSLCLGMLLMGIIFFLIQINEQLAFWVMLPLIIVFLFLAIFGIFSMSIALFWNGSLLIRRERLSLANLLPFILGSLIIFLAVASFIIQHYFPNETVLAVLSFVNILAFYFSAIFILYLMTSLSYNLTPIFGKIDYIIVLGAGLNGDQVTPLLASRIEAGAKLFLHQQDKKNHTPTLILSGGQGQDEMVSEAQAMAHYLTEHYPDIHQFLLETHSTNTDENLSFSEKIAQQQGTVKPFSEQKIVIATNNFHLLRAGKLAKKHGIRAQGVGSKTKWYYLPTAFIREYIGYLVLTKKLHLFIIGLLLVLTLGIYLLEFLLF